VPARGGIRAVHRVHAVGDPTRAAHVLTLHPGGRRALFLLPGLVQRRYPQRLVGQVLGRIPPDHAHRRVVVPHRMVEQSLGSVRRGVPGMFGDGPAVLARQVAHQRRDVALGLLKRLHPAETRPQPAMQLVQVRCRALALYDDSRSRLMIFLLHNMMILGRPLS